MHTVTTERVPILIWGEAIDGQALDQARNLANLPFVFDHVALMPDAHVGYGVPIGGVIATRGQVIPHAVGLDIGCGVRAWSTGVTATDIRAARDEVLGEIQRAVPQGFEWHRTSQASRTDLFDDVPDIPVLREQIDRAQRQVGTLGGGNHFIELQLDPDGAVWAMMHSGSRNVGKQMADHYDSIARAENRRTSSEVPAEWGLAHLDVASGPGAEYLAAMGWCLRFAAENRRLMSETVQAAIARRFPGAQPGPPVDVHHNYAACETHLGEEVVVHRKGAVRAVGPVIVPGSMGTASYLGIGLANPASFESCSHGAGRAMGRKAATRALSREHVLSELEAAGVRLVTASKHAVAEEAPEAYKDIEDVMRWQRDLVEARVRLVPIGVVLLPLPSDGPGAPELAAGVDVGYTKDGCRAWAAAVVMDRSWRVVSSAVVAGVPDAPYLPGYLAFREGRLTIEALVALDVEPDVVFFDGHGVVHERGLGLASHVGVLLGMPAVGVPKTPFHAIDHLPGPHRGDHYVLTKEWGAQGASVRLKAGVKPVYVSPGHLVDLDSAMALALAWSGGRHRVPEPLAAAHTMSALARNAGRDGLADPEVR